MRDGRQGIEARKCSAAAIKLVEGEEPERLVLAVVDLRNDNRSADSAAPLVLFGWSAGRGEETAGIQLFIANEVEAGAVKVDWCRSSW